jgi:hypothetical protein
MHDIRPALLTNRREMNQETRKQYKKYYNCKAASDILALLRFEKVATDGTRMARR